MHSDRSSLLPENVFGHTKKLQFMIKKIDEHRLRLGRPVSILDVGCGSGFSVTRFLPQEGDRCLGIDLFAPSIDYARKNYTRENMKFELMRAEDLMSLNSRYDIIVFSDVLEHVLDPGQLLENAHKLLEKEGIILASIPNGWGPFELESFVFRIPVLGKIFYLPTMYFTAFLNKYIFKHHWEDPITPKDIPYNADSGHLQFFTRYSFRQTVEKSGYLIEEARNLSCMSGPYTNTFWAQTQWFCKANNAIANSLPAFVTSAWVFVLRPQTARN